MTIKQAIAKLKRSNGEAATFHQLRALGPAAAEGLLDELSEGRLREKLLLSSALIFVSGPETVPALIAGARSGKIHARIAAMRALCTVADERVFDFLVDGARNQRGLAVEGLGDLGDARALDPLRELAREIMQGATSPASFASALQELEESSDLDLLTDCAAAMGKLGCHDLAPHMCLLSAHRRDDGEDMDMGFLRARAMEALKGLVAPELLGAARLGLEDPYLLVAEYALDVLTLLGERRAVELLVRAATHDDSMIAGKAYNCLQTVTGERPLGRDAEVPYDAAALARWWDERTDRFAPGVCYSAGQPLWIPSLFAGLEDPHRQDPTLDDLRIITGVDFAAGIAPNWWEVVGPVERATRWWSQEQQRFEAGGLFKYGRRQDLAALVPA
jgi:hypothetical protein